MKELRVIFKEVGDIKIEKVAIVLVSGHRRNFWQRQ